MATFTNAENQKISMNLVIPSPSSKQANTGDQVENILATIHVRGEGASAGAIDVTRSIYASTIAPNDTMLPNAQIGDQCWVYQFDSAQSTTGPFDFQVFKKTANGWVQGDAGAAIVDPGDAGAIPVTNSGTVALVTEGAETRTLAIPTFVGQEITISMKTDGGAGVVTVASAFNEAGNNTITFDDPGETVILRAVEVGAALAWRPLSIDGATASTV
jgi:hypothetical protein